MYVIDLNSDLGEGFGAYQFGHDDEILKLVTSANIACGFHAGDPGTMRKTVHSALLNNVAIGAHPGLPDLMGFGRRSLAISLQEAYDLVIYQVGALSAFVKAEGGKMQHVKPHGALYNMASTNADLANAIVEAVYHIDPELILFGLAGSEIIKSCQRIGLRSASETFADRTYQSNGTLTPRTDVNALIYDPTEAAKQVTRMVKEGKVRSVQGTEVELTTQTICIHGDSLQAVEMARNIRNYLHKAGITVKPVGKIII